MPRRTALTLLALLLLALVPAHAEHGNGDPGPGDAVGPSEDAADPRSEGDTDADPEGDGTGDERTSRRRSKLTEQVVVSASSTSQKILDAPAAVDVLPGEDLEARPADHIADQLRRIPGINVIQFSARDVNIASRGATGGINNSTLALADGRTLYQDFLGFVMWEFAPSDSTLVERVEVVRGPASALWGANAVGGLVHVITRSPRDTLGGRLLIESGSYGSRRVDLTESFLAGPWALRVSAGFYEAEPFPRPDTIENFLGQEIDPDLGLIKEDFRDSGTEQPRLDLRADWEGPLGGLWILQGGWARTRGWIATGLGPFDVDPATSLSYVQARYRRGAFEAQADFNYFDGEGKNLINALPFGFTAASSHMSLRWTNSLGERAVVGWGFDGKLSEYDLSIAPLAEERTQVAGFAEFDVGLAEKLRLVAGGRVDHVRETIGTVFSPRAALQYKPTPKHTLRLAWGRAFRSPSVIESDLLVPRIPVAIIEWEEIDKEAVKSGFPPIFTPFAEAVCSLVPDNCGVAPGEVPDYIAVTEALGSRGLEEEETESIEIGWAARIGRFGLQASVYRTRSDQSIDFPMKLTYGVGPDGLPGTDDDIVLPSDPDGDGIAEAPAIDVCPLIETLPPFRDLCLPRVALDPPRRPDPRPLPVRQPARRGRERRRRARLRLGRAARHLRLHQLLVAGRSEGRRRSPVGHRGQCHPRDRGGQGSRRRRSRRRHLRLREHPREAPRQHRRSGRSRSLVCGPVLRLDRHDLLAGCPDLRLLGLRAEVHPPGPARRLALAGGGAGARGPGHEPPGRRHPAAHLRGRHRPAGLRGPDLPLEPGTGGRKAEVGVHSGDGFPAQPGTRPRPA
jgi:outer membrane receptor protein involved in Fe transport